MDNAQTAGINVRRLVCSIHVGLRRVAEKEKKREGEKREARAYTAQAGTQEM